MTAGSPAHRGWTEQQRQRAHRHDGQRNPERRPVRAHREIPGDGQEQQLGEHGGPAPPALAGKQRSSGSDDKAAEQHKPDRSTEAVNHTLIGAAEPAQHQRRRDDEPGRALDPDNESRDTYGGRTTHNVSVATLASRLVRHACRADRQPDCDVYNASGA